MKRISLLLLLSFVSLIAANGQHFKSKKALAKEIDSLKTVISHMQAEKEQISYELEEMKTAYTNLMSADEEKRQFEVPEGEFYEAAFDDAGRYDRDTLLALYYKQRDLVNTIIDDTDFDSIILASDTPDSIYIERLRRMNSFIKIPYNEIVRNYLVAYTQKHKTKMESVLGLAAYYMPIFEEVFDRYHLPLELKTMAIIESALNPTAVSRAGAKGMWQFMLRTGKRYGLEVTTYVDERLDVEKAADAAAKYLRDSYLIFGDWSLAIASYNCGAGNVNKAIKRSGGGTDFWDVYRYLPKETRGYVPSFVAALYMLSYYKEHNMNPVPAPLPAVLDTLNIDQMLHFEQVTHFVGIPNDELKYHNPQYVQDIIPGSSSKSYILRLPVSYTPRFMEYSDSIYTWNDSVYFNVTAVKNISAASSSKAAEIVHKVKSGETLTHIAKKYGVRVSDLQRWNGVKSNLKIGQRIVVYPNGKPSGGSSSSVSSSSSVGTSSSGGYVTYKVKKGDSLSVIASKFSGVSVQSLMRLNGLSSKSRIYPGMTLKIKKKQ
ncbi:MAG: LysM peptidoglycan-binding domain-containing protein [Alistipes sp.]|nr:LysM peptidoglycan-binding domain-containing protein [Candidatus Minthomonas equi]